MLKCFLILVLSGFSVSAFRLRDKRGVLKNLHKQMTDPELGHFLATDDTEDVPEYEIIYVREKGIRRTDKESFDPYPARRRITFRAFGRFFDLPLSRNDDLYDVKTLKPKIRLSESEAYTPEDYIPRLCHYLHSAETGQNTIGSFSLCNLGEVRGMVLQAGTVFRVAPLTEKLQSHLLENEIHDESKGIPHLVRLENFHEALSQMKNSSFCGTEEHWNPSSFAPRRTTPKEFEIELDDEIIPILPAEEDLAEDPREKRQSGGDVKVEMCVYLDEYAYSKFAAFFQSKYDDLFNFVKGVINEVQLVYMQPSLGRKVLFTITNLELNPGAPPALAGLTGDRAQLLDKFCSFNSDKNKGADRPNKNDKDAMWCDLGLYMTGLNMYEQAAGSREPNYVTMGLAYHGGVCKNDAKINCVVGEIGVTNALNKPYPTGGFLSTYVMAHEIGHNLGMNHDGSGTSSSCNSQGFIMSPSRGVSGETTWSTCSRDVVAKLGTPGNYGDCLFDAPEPKNLTFQPDIKELPGQKYDADLQCQIFTREPDARLADRDESKLKDVCKQLNCRFVFEKFGLYPAGPALEGTYCGTGKWCREDACVSFPSGTQVTPGGWGNWMSNGCTDPCISSSKGTSTPTQLQRRNCDSPRRKNTMAGCDGPSVKVSFCKNARKCAAQDPPEAWAKKNVCSKLVSRSGKQLVPRIKQNANGRQLPHDKNQPWQACSVYCDSTDGKLYSPMVDLSDMKEPRGSFPDGTWCHNENGQNFYCMMQECRPESQANEVSGYASGDANDKDQSTLIQNIVGKAIIMADPRSLNDTSGINDVVLMKLFEEPKASDFSLTKIEQSLKKEFPDDINQPEALPGK